MGQKYTITKVSQEPPREHVNSYGTTYYIKVMLDKHDKPVTIGKKQPNSLKVGDTVYGRVVPTQYDADKWQGEQEPATQTSTPHQTYTPKDQDTIKAQWAIGQAAGMMRVYIQNMEKFDNPFEAFERIEREAKEFYAMVDRVRLSAPITKESVEQTFSDGSPVPDQVHLPVDDEPINLDDIPF